MNYKLEGRDILFNDEQLGPYPDHLLKRVGQPTNTIPGGQPRRKWQSESAKEVSGPRVKVGRTEPMFKAVLDVRQHLKIVSKHPNPVAAHKAPIPDDPRVRSRHLKSFGYFIGADLVGICEVPECGKSFLWSEFQVCRGADKHGTGAGSAGGFWLTGIL